MFSKEHGETSIILLTLPYIMNMLISSGGHLSAFDRPRRDLDLIPEFLYFYCTPGVGDHLSVLDRPRRDLAHDSDLQRSRPRD